MDDKKQILIKTYVMYIIVALVMLTVVVRVVNVQYGDIVPDAPMAADSSGVMTTKVDSISPMRGRILASDGSDLVSSIPLYDLHVDMTVISDELFEEVDSLAINLARIFPERNRTDWESYLRRGRSQDNQYLLIQNDVKYNILKEVQNCPILEKSQYKGGLIVEDEFVRQLPNGFLAKRTLGYKREGARPVGLEGAFDTYLSGEPGLRTKQWVNGSWKPVSADYLKDPVPGADVVTSLDIDIQEVAENELMDMLIEQEAVLGSVVLMEVETGFVKAIANLKRGEDGKYYESYNHAVGSKTDPGSTFKLASLMALLEDGKADITDEVGAYGEYHFYDHTTYDSHNGGYGRITLQEAFEVSSNVFSKIVNDAYQMDAQAYVDRLKSFGLGDTLGLDIAGEPMPVIKNRGEDGWSGITLPQMAIGYEVELTPIQILAFYNAVANGGELIKPQFVQEIRQGDKTLKEFEKVVIKDKICSDATLYKVQKCLVGVVKRGTGKMLQSANFDIAGKTGTAKIADYTTGTYSEEYQASFVGYFPADKPKYSCIVTIAGPTKQIYGAQVSGTVFTAIADKVYSASPEYQVTYNEENDPIPTKPKVKFGSASETALALSSMGISYRDNSQGSEWLSASNSEVISLSPQNVQGGKVPNVKGMPMNDAVFLLENMKLRVKVIGHGRVVKQSQSPGSQLQKGSQITIELR